MMAKGKRANKALTIERREDGVAVLTLDIPGEPVNTLKASFADDFREAVETLESSPEIRAAVLISGKKDNFLAGADITMLRDADTADAAAELARQGQRAMQRIADLRIPIVAAIHGSCLGGGLELAMACHARVATDSSKTKLGLPEVQLGLLPGAGGTQRLPRLVGIQAALDLILTGKQIPAKKAKSLGLVDEVVPQPSLLKAAVDLALSLSERGDEAQTPLDRMTSALKHLFSSEELSEFVLEDNPVGRKVLFDQARKKLLSKTKGNYPGPERALDAVRVGANKGMERGLEVEAQHFGELVVSPEARQLMNIFFATQELKKDSGTDAPGAEARPVHKVGVLGGGLMGAGIAYVTATSAGLPVRIKDKDHKGVRHGLAYVNDILSERVKRRRMTPRQRLELMHQVTGTTDYTGFAEPEVVIEAVFEDLDIKHRVLREVEEAGREDVIFASNTSTIPITKIAEASKHPETVIGMHYFSPVHKMPLLEIIVTDKTAPWVTATCVELGKKQGKTVIVVRDGVGFYTSRILGPYMNEAMHILAEGVPVDLIDRALVSFGFPVGPVKLLDEVGLDVAQKASSVVRSAFGERIDAPAGMDALIADQRLGRKNGKGFYLYGKKQKGVDESVYEVLGLEPKKQMDPEQIALRCTLQMVNEAAHCFGEGILRSARDGDIGAIFGLGFPPFRGGPFRYVDSVGPEKIVQQLEGYAANHGRRFQPAPVLVELARSGKTFYGANELAPGDHGERIVNVG
jgi:3-hydroxyacyl-CoA dehydrogenase / enoyl-CoA hydratase / 3-hydroxybutyryl-CoA epimerase